MVCATWVDWARGGWQQVLQVSRERDQPTASDHQQLWGQGPPWQQPWHCSKLIKNVKTFTCLFFKYVCDDTCLFFAWFVWVCDLWGNNRCTGQMWSPLHVCKYKTHNQDQQLNKCEILWLLFFLTALLYITTLFYTQILSTNSVPKRNASLFKTSVNLSEW